MGGGGEGRQRAQGAVDFKQGTRKDGDSPFLNKRLPFQVRVKGFFFSLYITCIFGLVLTCICLLLIKKSLSVQVKNKRRDTKHDFILCTPVYMVANISVTLLSSTSQLPYCCGL